MMSAVIWFRRDLRLSDNPAWVAATREHDRVTALFVIDPRLWDGAPPRRTRLLAANLSALDARLGELGGRLRILRGNPQSEVCRVADGNEAVYWNNDYTPFAQTRDEAVARRLPGSVSRHNGSAVHPPGSVLTGAGAPYRVFTPYWRKWSTLPGGLPGEPGVATIDSDPGIGVPEHPTDLDVGERAAEERLLDFLDRIELADPDRPDQDGTSRLSTDLKYGTIAPRRIRAVAGEQTPVREAFIRQLCWRDFYMQILARWPKTVTRPFRPEYASIVWRDDPEGLEAWTQGRTGYPIVDAAMRQLAEEGWIHNRVRMIAASFLVKDLLIDWRLGERWFRRQLIDADVAQNVGNWQWVAGTGTDAAPYFRVLNPITQGRRFDPHGDYVRRWVPELAGIKGAAIHAPWTLNPTELSTAGVALGDTYPAPIVDHDEARREAIAAFAVASSPAAGNTP
jgi:deoxyribodipyrimidine photo-lyase